MNPLTYLMIRRSHRSWWQCRYADGRVLAEWDTLAGPTGLALGDGRSSRWEEVPKKGMVGLRLLCPNGMAGELEAPEGFKFFQLKVGYFDVLMNKGGSSRSTAAHIIGVVQNANGDCLCRAWEYKTGRLATFTDNVYHFAYEQLGPLSLEVQGLKI